MKYDTYTVKEMIQKIGNNDVYLPAIQRKFVWHVEQIESFFDSIMRDYPIGTFLFWFVSGDNKNEYTFYKFIQEWHQRDNRRNEVAPKPELKDEIIGILDGQQRLSSMYIALQGSYQYKKRYARWEDDSAFPKRRLYANLLKGDVLGDDDEYLYEFKFLTDSEARTVDKDHLWFSARDVLSWGSDPDVDEYYDRLIEGDGLTDDVKQAITAKKRLIKRTLGILHKRLVVDELINFYKVKEQDLDKILDIFVRVNSGGTVLAKSDLLFSTIVANWEQARDEIETLLDTINRKGQGFRFDIDFVMRACLVLTDAPVLFKVKAFKKENIDRVMRDWRDIRSSIERTVDLLVDFGFNGENLTSQNATIPVAYYFMKGGRRDRESKDHIRRYLIHALLKQTFGGQGDRVLTSIRAALREQHGGNYVLKADTFCLDDLIRTIDLPGQKTLEITNDDIDEIVGYSKGPYTFMVLSLLYPHLKYGQVNFHQDHIHPASLFTDAKLRKHGIAQAEWDRWKGMKDLLPNLQLMEGAENERKNKTPFSDWLHASQRDPERFLAANYIPDNVSLKFEDFGDFFNERQRLLWEEIARRLL